ncbi:hypothetical protein [Nakamurella aerolata]|uniref:Uncharacterized protein n=1 Tax=Nakamurella aerolata TaxID=1656892 RepID=A0A849ACN1_9ACTN|nr:hypothetical protein [Nakamurella aerolata]NNG36918.1 hypothetical protein [Nakamurella aerolata]
MKPDQDRTRTIPLRTLRHITPCACGHSWVLHRPTTLACRVCACDHYQPEGLQWDSGSGR